jgi:hypothetical protein
MRSVGISATVVVAMFIVPGATRAQPAGEDARRADIGPKARQVLKQMSGTMQEMEAFRFKAAHETDVVMNSGQKVQLGAESEVVVERPDHVRSERKGELADVTLYYDGDQVTLFGERSGFYATADAPPTIDETVDFLRDRLGMEVPAGDLLYSDFYQVMLEDAVSGEYVGRAMVRGVSTHHLAFRGQNVDWQIWVEDSPRALPRKYVITSKDMDQAPQFTVELYDWETMKDVPDDAFTFVPPAGAERISFLGLDGNDRQPRARR